MSGFGLFQCFNTLRKPEGYVDDVDREFDAIDDDFTHFIHEYLLQFKAGE